jgi:hypothetical protein
MANLSDMVSLRLNGVELNRLSLGGKTIWTKPPSYRYKIVEYLTFNGDGYVDTMYVPEDYDAEAKLSVSLTLTYESVVEDTRVTVALMGASDGTNYIGTYQVTEYANNVSATHVGYYAGTKNAGITYPQMLGVKTTITSRNRADYMRIEALADGADKKTAEQVVSGSILLGRSLYVGRCNGVSTSGLKGLVYSVKMGTYNGTLTPYQPTTLYASLIPVVSASGMVGMFDTVRELFCPASGTVTAGPDTGEFIV